MKKILLIASILLGITTANYASQANDIVGTWFLPENESGKTSVAQIYELNGIFYANGFAFKDFSEGALDVANPNPKLRDRNLNKTLIFCNIKFDSKSKEWGGGKIYNPENGKTYRLKIKFSDDKKTLLLKASLDKAGVFGKKLVWTPVPDPKIYEKLKTPIKDIETTIPE